MYYIFQYNILNGHLLNVFMQVREAHYVWVEMQFKDIFDIPNLFPSAERRCSLFIIYLLK